MRRFSSYGPVINKIHYYAPREELIEFAYRQIVGKNYEEGGHYITIWAPRQTGKTWTMQQILWRLQKDDRFYVLKINLEHLKMEKNVGTILNSIGKWIIEYLDIKGFQKDIKIDEPEIFQKIFEKAYLKKSLILILDEFDALEEEAISAIVGVFRNIYNIRRDQGDKAAEEKDYLLHGVALIGVRSVLGIENEKGSPFNVQRSVHIPNLTFEEVKKMFRWHEEESGQKIEQEVIERLFYETKGQPGLTCWFGELLTEGWDGFEVTKDMPVDMELFEEAYTAASYMLPNNNILNIISKAKKEPYKQTVLKLFGTKEKIAFSYDKVNLNFLYMNGVIDFEKGEDKKLYVKFSSPFVQKRLFNYFTDEIFDIIDDLYEPFDDIDSCITEKSLNIKNIMKLYGRYLVKNKEAFLINAPRRHDMRIYEAVFHFNLYSYLSRFIRRFKGEIYPEFPTGNGKIDLILKYAGKIYGIELKSYTDNREYKTAAKQAAHYGKQLGLEEISLIFFIESIDDENRKKYEVDFYDEETRVKVMPIFVETGSEFTELENLQN